MINTDEDALVCDFAETYHIYDFKKLAITDAAVLACGLPASSRIVRKMSGQDIDMHTALLALIVDDLNLYIWMQSKDAKHRRNRPKSVYKLLTEKNEPKQERTFTSAEDFEKARQRILAERTDKCPTN